MSNPPTLEALLKKDRLIITAGLLLLTLISWIYILYLYQQMEVMNMEALFVAMPMSPTWTATDFVLLLLMWMVMMVAMMTPSIVPLVLAFAKVNRQRKATHRPYVPTVYLVAGYFITWAAFSIVATVLQWGLQQLSLLNPEMETTSKVLGSAILIATGLFQFTPLKQTCLTYCRTPMNILLHHWKEGKTGALRMGIENGVYCVGCCWMLMLLLFVAGIMNVVWIAIIALFVLVEKIFSNQPWVSYIAGIALVLWGVFLLIW